MEADGSYRSRVVDGELDELFAGLPAIALEGAKGVGKTETAVQRAATTWFLEAEDQRALILADPARLVAGPHPTLIDEWQHVPSSWDLIRRAVDADRSPGRFLLTGSSTLKPGGTHSGAGRIVRVRMRPLALSERGAQPTVSLRDLLTGSRPAISGHTSWDLARYAEEIGRSGFPGMRGERGRLLRAQLDGYLESAIDRDLPELGAAVRNPTALRRWLRAYAAASSTCASYEAIRDAATARDGDKPARSTTLPYRDALERLWVLDPIPAWLPTHGRLRRLADKPKHQLADPALAAALLGIDVGALAKPALSPSGNPNGALLGRLFESLVALSVRVYAQQGEARVGHLRMAGGEREIDLIVERADGAIVAIEVKLSRTVDDHDLRHLRWLGDRLGDTLLDRVVITTGADAYRREDGVAVIPAALLGP
ncbi:MAG: DUF4143 domain-containing protein [Patulibacter sp.]